MQAAIKLLVIAYDGLPDKVFWSLIHKCKLQISFEVEVFRVSPDNEILEYCKDWDPDYILDLTHDLFWSAAFLTARHIDEATRHIPYLNEGEPHRVHLTWATMEYSTDPCGCSDGSCDCDPESINYLYAPRPVH